MKRAFIIFATLAVIVVCGCTESLDDGAGAPTLAPLPTVEPVPTVEPLPTIQTTPTAMPESSSSNDPIIGTWEYRVNGTLVTYLFIDDGTFERHDADRGTAYTGVWERKGGDTYELIYDTPASGVTKETVTYYSNADRLEINQTLYARA